MASLVSFTLAFLIWLIFLPVSESKMIYLVLVLVVLLGLEACLLAQPRTCNGVDATGVCAVSVGQL